MLYMHNKSLMAEFKDSNPELFDEWDYELNAKDGRYIDKPLFKSAKIHWLCRKGHRWIDTLSHRLSRGSKCPICQNKKVVKGINDLATICPNLAEEWDYERNQINPYEVTYGSNKSVWWICKNGHENYKQSIVRRYHGAGCQVCNTILQTSFPEQAILFYVKKLFPNAKNKYRDPFKGVMELDIFIPTLNVGIEYDGKAWHKGSKSLKKEEKKYKICSSQGIFLYRFKEIEESLSYSDKTIFVGKFNEYNYKSLDDAICSLLNDIAPDNNVDVDVERDRFLILEYKIIKFEDSLCFLFPEIAKEWHPTKNGKLSPEKMIPGSNFRAWWKCSKCGNEWVSSVVNRTKGHGCDLCAQEQRKITYHKTRLKTRKLLLDQKCLLDWNYDKNLRLPSDYTKGSGDKVWWKCHTCGFEWQTQIVNRTRGYKGGCPACSNRLLVRGRNDLATTNPELIKEWHPTKNGDLKPSDVAKGTHQKVWWKCSKCGYSYEAKVYNRVLGKGCGCCAGRVVVQGINDLATTEPAIALDWHPTKNGDLKPSDVTKGRRDMIWWKCHICGYEWQDTLNHRSRGRGCRVCKKRI